MLLNEAVKVPHISQMGDGDIAMTPVVSLDYGFLNLSDHVWRGHSTHTCSV